MPQQNDREAEGWPGSDKNRAKAQPVCVRNAQAGRTAREQGRSHAVFPSSAPEAGTIPAEQRPGAVAATARRGERKQQSLERHRQAIVSIQRMKERKARRVTPRPDPTSRKASSGKREECLASDVVCQVAHRDAG